MKKIFGFVLWALLAITLSGAGLWLAPKGFNYIAQMRQLERVPETVVGATLPGEANIQAYAEAGETLLPSHLSQTPSIYYRYRHEIEERDSDGNTNWRTEEEFYQASNFWLIDNTGKIRVNVTENPDNLIDWDMPYSLQRTEGKHRYTEWRVEPGDRLFTFAKAVEETNPQDAGPTLTLRYDQPGYFSPIISKENAFAAREGMGTRGILLLWLSLSAFGFALFCIISLLRIHRVLVFLSILAISLGLILFQFGWQMMKEDTEAGLQRYQQHLAASESASQQIFTQNGLSWPGWLEAGNFFQDYTVFNNQEQLRLWHIRLNVATARERLAVQLQSIPDRWFVAYHSINIPPPINGLPEADHQTLLKRVATFQNSQITGIWTWIVPGLMLLAVAILLYFGIRSILTKRLIESLPTSPCQGVVYGMAEAKGKLTQHEAELLKGPLTQKECVWFDYLVEQKQGSGKDAKWVTIEHLNLCQDFMIEDSSGQLLVDPVDAEVVTQHRDKRTHGNLRYTEQRLAPNDNLYAIGFADIHEDGQRLCLKASDAQDAYILSNLSESALLQRKGRLGMGLMAVAFSAMTLAALVLFARQGGFAATDFLQAALVTPVLLVFLMLILHYNDLVFLRRRCERNQSNIAISLRKRFDLIPNLEAAVKQYLSHEKTLQTMMSRLRDQSGQLHNDTSIAHYLATESQVNQQLRAVIENYPDLKAKAVIQKLMDTLSQLENEIAFMRSGYFDALESYNQRIATFPDMILARSFGFKEISWQSLADQGG